MAFCSSVKTYLHLVFLHPSVFLNRLPLGNTAAIIVTIITFFLLLLLLKNSLSAGRDTKLKYPTAQKRRRASSWRRPAAPAAEMFSSTPAWPSRRRCRLARRRCVDTFKAIHGMYRKTHKSVKQLWGKGGWGGGEQQQHGASETLKQTQRKSVFFSSSAHNIDLQAAVLLLTVNIAVYKNTTLPLLLNWILTNECYFPPAPHHHHPPSRTCL